MSNKPKRIGLFQTSQRQQPFAEFVEETQTWRIWLAFNPSVTSGTYLLLHNTGAVDRVTIRDDDVLDYTKVI